MKYLHTMVRVSNLEESLHFYCNILGLKEMRRKEVPAGEFTLVFLATEQGEAEIELTYNWESNENYETGRSWGHLAFEVDNIYDYCKMLQDNGITINRPPRDGKNGFYKISGGCFNRDSSSMRFSRYTGSMERYGKYLNLVVL